MRTEAPAKVSRVLFGRTRGSILALIFGQSDRQFYLRQIARRIGVSVGAVQRDLEQLVAAELITREAIGHQVFYQANRNSNIFPEMRSLVAKTVGIFDVLHTALSHLSSRVTLAFVYGSVAKHEETAQSDIDLMIIGRLTLDETVAALSDAQLELGREINPTIYSAREFRTKLAAGNHFVTSVVRGDKLFLIGGEDELRNLAPKRLAQETADKSR